MPEAEEVAAIPLVEERLVVREKLVVRKDVEERTERVSERLRRTEVDVEQIGAAPEPADPGGEAGDVQLR